MPYSLDQEYVDDFTFNVETDDAMSVPTTFVPHNWTEVERNLRLGNTVVAWVQDDQHQEYVFIDAKYAGDDQHELNVVNSMPADKWAVEVLRILPDGKLITRIYN